MTPRPRCSSTRRRRRRGYAMLSVLVLLTVGLVFATIQQRQIGATLALEQSRVESEDFQQGAVSVTARALTLLETGLPPSSPYECRAVSGGETYRVVFTQYGSNDWRITVAPTSDFLPWMPQVFVP